MYEIVEGFFIGYGAMRLIFDLISLVKERLK